VQKLFDVMKFCMDLHNFIETVNLNDGRVHKKIGTATYLQTVIA